MSNQQSAMSDAGRPNGAAAASVLAAGIGCLALGFLTTLAVISSAVNNALNWYNPVGPLAGKTGLAYVIWLVSWVIIHQKLKDKQTAFVKVYTWGLVLILLGLLGTFPPFFERFHH